MRISDLLAGVLIESLTGISADELGISALIDRADDGLDGEAASAIDAFTGMGPGAKHQGIWGGIMQSNRLEDAFSDSPSPRGMAARQQIEMAFAPVKQELRQRFGNTITLYRAQGAINPDAKQRHTLSWTSDYPVAAEFAGVDARLLKLKPIDDLEVEQAFRKYENTGRLKWRGREYVRTDSTTNDPSVDEFYYDILDRDGDVITDGDDMRAELESAQKSIQDLIDRRDQRLSTIVSADIPVDDIIWITNRAGQSEFILRNRVGTRGHIDQHGILVPGKAG